MCKKGQGPFIPSYFFPLILSFCFFSCQPDSTGIEPVEEIGFAGVDERLWPFFDNFEREGAERGVDVDLRTEGVTGVIESIDGDNVAGQCNYHPYRSNHVIIDDEFWEQTGTLYQEFIVFHELGHCSLDRGHLESEQANGSCVSIMRSGNGSCWDNYRGTTREAYLDELFLGDGPSIGQ